MAGKLHWLYVLATTCLTWMGIHPNRGKKAFDAFGLLSAFVGTLVHDGWKPYRDLACHHALCNTHHLGELTYVFEQMGQSWANRLIEMLLAACQEVERGGGPLPHDRIAYFRSLYLEILAEGEAANPRAPPSGKRGRTHQSKAVNLLHRLRTYTDDVLRFMTDPGVPFTSVLLGWHFVPGRGYVRVTAEPLPTTLRLRYPRSLLRAAPALPLQRWRQVARNASRGRLH